MTTHREPAPWRDGPSQAALLRGAEALCLAVMLIGGCVLMGWILDPALLAQVAPLVVTAKANTAFGMVLLSAAVFLTLRPAPGGIRLWLAYTCAGVVVALAALSLLEHALRTDFGIDQLLATDPGEQGGQAAPGRVPRITAVGFIMLSLALFAQTNPVRPLRAVSRISLWLTGALAAQALISYIVDAQVLLGGALPAQMSLHSSVMFIALCVALTMGQRLLRTEPAASTTSGDAVFQAVLMTTAVMVPPAFQAALQWGRRAGYFSEDFGATAQVTVNSLFMLGIVYLSFASLRARTAQLERGRQRFARLAEDFKVVEREKAQLYAERLVAQAAKLNEQRLQAILEGAFDAVVSIDAQGLVTAWNGKAEEMFGWSKAQALAHPLRDLIVPEEHRAAHAHGLQRYLETGHEVLLNREVEVEACRQDATRLPIRLFITPVKMGDEITFTAFISDITARRRNEADLRQAQLRAEQAAAVKSQFLAHMSHEIRTPLNGILGLTDILLESGLTEPQLQHANILKGAGRQLLDIVNDILDFSKMEAGRFQLEALPFDVRELVHKRVTLMQSHARGKQLRLHHQVEDDVPACVLGDPGRLGQVLLNLMSNAIKFTEAGAITLRVATSAGRLRFSVQDSGSGMTAEVQASLFQPFYQADSSTSRRYGGTGLGLAISQQLVELMGGRLEVASVVGQGSTFSFDLPLKAVEKPQAEATPDVAESDLTILVDGKAPRVLVAEDNSVNQLVVVAQLRKLGCESRVVANGSEAVDAFKQERFDAVLMDCHMPEMDGFEATSAIRAYESKLHRHTPIVALTASALPEDIQRCLTSGMDAHICKPIHRKTFQAVLQSFFGGAPARDGHG